ncbi:hypothetical protein MMIN_01690 [Mycolicibacter minnesotensis]|nr:hypothetical protein MMIN_01690 [Mycolicibacter minnesotensis]
MLGGYPRSFTEARMTLRIVRCRAVNAESGPAALLVLSLMRPNLVVYLRLIKHVFEVCRAGVRRDPGLSYPFANVFDNKSITCSDIEHTIDYYSNSRANRVADAE